MTIDLKGRNILVTGASRGIGESIARHMAGAGARVALHYNQNHEMALELSKALGPDARCYQADLANEQAIIQMFNTILEQFGHLDVIVNNAGTSITSPLAVDDDTWLQHWHHNGRKSYSSRFDYQVGYKPFFKRQWREDH